MKAVVIGDRYSMGDGGQTWVNLIATDLGWEITNLASQGRGYIVRPDSCHFDPCATFEGSIGAVTAAKPDLVVTFGGTADGDQDLRGASAYYFEALRDALPDARLVGISPITTNDEWPHYLTMHANSVKAAVEAVDGIFVDARRVGLGDGETLSAESQQKIADAVIAALS
ncbi:MAG: SGNH/GDSL hydrolase family protein [Propionibacteriaceae bacterium]|nr:SGNH/GDSL hydrolase family protein [Propionibacteriaceae bacterium]